MIPSFYEPLIIGLVLFLLIPIVVFLRWFVFWLIPDY